MISIICPVCGNEANKETSAFNRALKLGAPMFCSRECAGKNKRKNLTESQKKEEKRLYDIDYRKKNIELLKSKKHDYYIKNYDKDKERVRRKKRSHLHAEYCRKPEYKLWKKEYDKKYNAKKNYGEYWECFLISQKITEECLARESNYTIKYENNCLNKTQRRKRHEQSERNITEKRIMGNTEQC